MFMDFWRPWSPLAELERFRRDFEDMMARLAGGERPVTVEEEAIVEPPAECFIEEGKLFVRLDLPGVDPADIEVKAAEGVLTVTATRKEQPAGTEREFLECELPYGTFERTIELPEGARSEDVRASYRNGVLELTVPIEAPKPKEVKIRVETAGGEAK